MSTWSTSTGRRTVFAPGETPHLFRQNFSWNRDPFNFPNPLTGGMLSNSRGRRQSFPELISTSKSKPQIFGPQLSMASSPRRPSLQTGLAGQQCRRQSNKSIHSSPAGMSALSTVSQPFSQGTGRVVCPQGRMSQSGDGLHTPGFLSWKKLQLSRAKLKASSKTSALLSGFAMVAMVEVQLSNETKVPQEMLIAFAVCTTLLVAVHMLALMISTCILPNIDAVCNMHSISLVHESPHERLHWYIETAWAFSTLLGLLLFLCEIAILCWVKFYDFSQIAAWSACILLIPVLIVFLAFAVHFYRSLVSHKYDVSASGIRELELLKEQIEAGDMDGRANGMNSLLNSTQVV